MINAKRNVQKFHLTLRPLKFSRLWLWCLLLLECLLTRRFGCFTAANCCCLNIIYPRVFSAESGPWISRRIARWWTWCMIQRSDRSRIRRFICCNTTRRWRWRCGAIIAIKRRCRWHCIDDICGRTLHKSGSEFVRRITRRRQHTSTLKRRHYVWNFAKEALPEKKRKSQT